MLLLLIATANAILLKADATTERTSCWLATLGVSHNVHWYFGTMTGTLDWAGPHHALGAQTVRLLLA